LLQTIEMITATITHIAKSGNCVKVSIKAPITELIIQEDSGWLVLADNHNLAVGDEFQIPSTYTFKQSVSKDGDATFDWIVFPRS